MNVVHTGLEGLLVLEPRVFRDDRGFFVETWNRRTFRDAVGRDAEFVQDNQSHSTRGVLRGLHYQRAPSAQCKLVRVLSGAIYDVAVDVRRDSPTLGQWVGVELTAENHRQFWVPEGFAHGFLVLSETADVAYKVTTYYDPTAEECIRWNDPEVGVAWPIGTDLDVRVSPKDALGKAFRDTALY
jgi:dTDP-4-dehydrorhamnose 3,5-epimerase